MPPPLTLGHNNIILKHIVEPADSVRVEEVSSALRQTDRATGPGGGERKAGMSSQVMLVAPAKTGQLVSGGVAAAARSVNGRNAAHTGSDRQETALSSDLCSDRMAFIGGAGERNVRFAQTYAPSSLERGEVAMGRVVLPSPAPDGDGADRGEHAPAAERKDVHLGVVAEAATVAIRSPCRWPTAPRIDVIAGQDDTVNPAINAAASGKASGVDQETDLHCPRFPSGEHIPSSARHDNPIGSSAPSTCTSLCDTNGERDLYDIGVAAALAMDTEVLRSEIARYLGPEANREQRPRRRARQRNAPAPPVKFSLRLSVEEATEDVEAVTLAKDVKLEEAEGMPARRNAKRRRH
ncbi:hypothetical protein ACQJBY_015995 [Aegilops geniculata]